MHMRKLRTLAGVAAGTGALALGALLAGPASASAVFMAQDSNGAFTENTTPVSEGEVLTLPQEGGRAVQAVNVIQRSNGYGGYYWQFHVTDPGDLAAFTGQVQFAS